MTNEATTRRSSTPERSFGRAAGAAAGARRTAGTAAILSAMCNGAWCVVRGPYRRRIEFHPRTTHHALLNLHHLRFFLVTQLIGLDDEAVGEPLQACLAVAYVVVGGHVLLAQVAQVL